MKKLLASLLSVTLSVSSAQAVPQVLNFQGRLSESGSPSNGSRQITFRIHASPTGGTALFAETRTIAVSSGIFNALIGEETPGGIPLAVFDGSDRYVEVQVGSTVLPRQKMASVGHAFFADRARSLAEGISVNVTSIVVTNIQGASAAFTGEVVVGEGTIHMQSQIGGQYPNAITITQQVAQNIPQIRTSDIGNANTSSPAPTGATPLIVNAGVAGNLFLNPYSSGSLLLTKSTVTNTGSFVLASDASLSMSGPAGTITSGSSVTASGFFGASVDARSARFGTGVDQSLFSAAGALTFPAGYLPTVPQDAASKAYVDSLVGGAGIWTKNGSVVALASPTDNVVMQSTVTVQGNEFSVGGSLLNVSGGNVGIGTLSPVSTMTVAGSIGLTGIGAPPVAPAGTGRLFFDTVTNKLKVSENSGAYVNLIGGAGGGVTLQASTPGTADTGHLNITGTGLFGSKVGIGTTSPIEAFDVNGNMSLPTTVPSPGTSFSADRSITYYDNNGVTPSARILFEQDTAPGHGNEPGEISFHTRPHDVDGGGLITERMRINRGGNVGIGTSSPVSTMTVAGSIGLNGIGAPPVAPAGTGRLYFDTSTNKLKISENSGSYVNLTGVTLQAATPGTADTGHINITGTGLFGSKVGIGTTNPIDAFDVNGNISLPTTVPSPGTSFSADRSITYYDNNGVTPSARIKFEQDTAPGIGNEPGEISFHTRPHDVDGGGLIAERMRINRGGNVGIGTSSPVSTMTVAGSIGLTGIGAPPVAPAGTGRLYYDTGANKLKISENSGAYVNLVGGGVTLQASTPGTADTGHLNITGTGLFGSKVGIGTANPISAFDVNGNMSLPTTVPSPGTSFSADRSITYYDNDGVTPSARILFEQDTAPGIGNEPGEISFHTKPHDVDGGGLIAERMRINRRGNVGIGTTGPTARLDVAGQFGPQSRTRAQMDALVPDRIGTVVFCSDCAVMNLCVSTGTAVAQWRRVDSATAGCGSGN